MNHPRHFSLPRDLPAGFRIIEEIGRGGMGVVYRGVRISNDELVAVKMLHSNDDPTQVGRFMREVRILAGMQSPHIVDILSFGRTLEEEIFMVMEHLQGDNLDVVLAREHRLEPGLVGHIALQVAQGLHAVHEAGIVHRDLKPGNVMLITTPDDPHFVKILDFGIAKHAGEGRSEHTETGMVMGTLGAMSPEQLLGDALDGRADVYALGVLMYQMLTGTRPFEDGRDKNLVKMILTQWPPMPGELLGDGSVPKALDDIIGLCLQKDRNDRHRDMAALAQALEAADLPAPRKLQTTKKDAKAAGRLSLGDAARMAFPNLGETTDKNPLFQAGMGVNVEMATQGFTEESEKASSRVDSGVFADAAPKAPSPSDEGPEESDDSMLFDPNMDAAPLGDAPTPLDRPGIEVTTEHTVNQERLSGVFDQSTELQQNPLADTLPGARPYIPGEVANPVSDTQISSKRKESLPDAFVVGSGQVKKKKKKR
jgi:serine/threonine protein kinase